MNIMVYIINCLFFLISIYLMNKEFLLGVFFIIVILLNIRIIKYFQYKNRKLLSDLFSNIEIPIVITDLNGNIYENTSNFSEITNISEIIKDKKVLKKENTKFIENNMKINKYVLSDNRLAFIFRSKNIIHKTSERLVFGILYVDNYQDSIESIEESRKGIFQALVDRKINQYFNDADAIVKKLEKDKYLVLIKENELIKLSEDKFQILEEMKEVSIGHDTNVTISIGFGVVGNSYKESFEFARIAIDLALSRGGNQIVIKTKNNIEYFGGNSAGISKNTKVKSRVKAHAIKDLMQKKDKVLIMGHSMGDVDALGAAIGVYRIAKTLEKEVHIVFNDISSSVGMLLDRLLADEEYEQGRFIKTDEALEIVDKNTLLVIVDVNQPSFTDCPKLIDLVDSIVIIDHHRQSGEIPDNVVCSYIEPAASSACEMVTEILQYIDNVKIKQVEADALYSGILLDTNHFSTKASVRTFEAAAFLRKKGADIVSIRQIFKSDISEIQHIADIVSKAKVYKDEYIFALNTAPESVDRIVIGAKAANELLDIRDIKASFVFTKCSDFIHISARSVVNFNVQVIMEKLGGGGHSSAAGAQVDLTLDETIKKVQNLLDEI